VQEQNIPTYRIIARLPYWILLCWLGIGLTGHIYFKKDPIFIPEKAPKPAIIRVNNPLCLKCVSDRALLLFPFRSHLYRIDAHSKWVAEKRKLYHINNDTFYIYIKSNGQEILLPEKLTRKTLAQSLSN
ncbi:MAG: hypothetical protein SPL08_05075, partial [Pseudomonadota bacterium]|nr:hypothetical protein [Pseudomonadota bacterium]